MGGRRAIRRLHHELPETAVVQDMTIEGQGVASVGGKRVFIAGAITGETVTFRRVRGRRNYDEAELLEVAEPAVERVAPRCGYFGVCGGCSLQHLSPAGQVALKERTLVESLRRIGEVTPGRLMPAVTAPPWGYRRRARLGARYVDGKGRVLVGFSERNSSWIADMRGCEILHPAVAALIGPLSDLIGGLSIRQRVPQVEVAVADNATVLVFRVLEPPVAADLAALRAFRDRHGVRVLLQPGGPDTLQPLDAEVDGGDLWYAIEGTGLRMVFGPTDFIQVNGAVNERMIGLARDLLAPEPGMRLLDLYCGIGNFTLPLARLAGEVLGVEGEAAMVQRARDNARLNGVANAQFAVADLSGAAGAAGWSGRAFDAVLLDPPRAGAAAMMAPLAATGARRILYVSCHPGTLARDAGTLVRDFGYRLAAAGILDMFPSTSHVESVALFERD
jgi:23S rRNA (uracil1939-C5)-methyltransferase